MKRFNDPKYSGSAYSADNGLWLGILPDLLISDLIHPMSIPTTLEGFDVTGAVDRMLGRPDLWWQALGLFLNHFEDWEKAWGASIGDDAAERGQVHALGSAAANVGAMTLSADARALERALVARMGGNGAAVDEAMRMRLQVAFRATWSAADAARRQAAQADAGGHS